MSNSRFSDAARKGTFLIRRTNWERPKLNQTAQLKFPGARRKGNDVVIPWEAFAHIMIADE
jgi:hypothetical protein